jgi:2-dehydropantoate 2-reductase
MHSASPRFLVMGCGGIGGVLAGCLAHAGHHVTVVTTNEGLYESITQRGLRVVGEGVVPALREGLKPNANFAVSHGVPTSPNGFDYIVLATQPPQVEEAARTAQAALAGNGTMICLQNGLCEERIAAIVGQERVVGAVVAWGASMVEPGMYERTAPGGFTLGRITTDPNAVLGSEHDALVHAFSAVGPVETTLNLRGKRWSKLALNCAISSLGTLGGDRLGVLLQHRFVRRLALEIMTEVVEVSRRERVRLEKVAGTIDLDWIALDAVERVRAASPGLVAKHALLLAVGFRYRRMRSSMLSAIERGKPPAVDFLNGEVVKRARHWGMRVPVNENVHRAVWSLAEGKTKPGLDVLHALYKDTGPHGA